MMGKEEVVIQFEVLLRNLCGNTRNITKNITIIGPQAEDWRWGFPNTKRSATLSPGPFGSEVFVSLRQRGSQTFMCVTLK
jgi:hypothetical protein